MTRARGYALVAAAAALVIAVYLLRDGWPGERGDQVGAVVGIVLAAVPPVVLFLFSQALRALADLPARIRALPQTGRERAEKLNRLVHEADRARGRGRRRLPLTLWRLARAVGDSRELLAPHAAALPLLSAGFLAWTALAAAAALVEIAIAAVLALVLLLS